MFGQREEREEKRKEANIYRAFTLSRATLGTYRHYLIGSYPWVMHVSSEHRKENLNATVEKHRTSTHK